VYSADVPAGYVLGVANQQGPDLLSYSKSDRLLGGLMVGLVNTAAMARLRTPYAEPVTAPPPRPSLSRLGGTPRRPRAADLLVA
jgi:hypothetical protein